jgi:hypothetical protein
MTPGISVTGVVLLLRLSQQHVRPLLPGPADSLTMTTKSAVENPSQLLAVLHHLEPQPRHRLTTEQAARHPGIRMKAGNRTVHHAHRELGILRRLL